MLHGVEDGRGDDICGECASGTCGRFKGRGPEECEHECHARYYDWPVRRFLEPNFITKPSTYTIHLIYIIISVSLLSPINTLHSRNESKSSSTPPNSPHTMLLMSWMSTVRVDSPDQPRLLLAVTMNRAPGSTTGRTAKKCRWQRTMRRCVRHSPRSRCGDIRQQTHRERKKEIAKSMLEARGAVRTKKNYPRICEIMPPWCPGIILNGTPDRPLPPPPPPPPGPTPSDSPASLAFQSRMLSFDALIQSDQGHAEAAGDVDR